MSHFDFSYRPVFDPHDIQTSKLLDELTTVHRKAGPATEPVYIYSKEITLAINVALVTGRPLLLKGSPGSGKTTLARSVAWKLGWKYYGKVISSRTRAQELQWHFDALHRLHDAQAQLDVTNPKKYINPGILWWALDPESAAIRGYSKEEKNKVDRDEYKVEDPGEITSSESKTIKKAVVLLDEIDKADPDVPNNLLEVLDAHQFSVDQTDIEVSGEAPLIFITSNGERELPDAFLRRCLVFTLHVPGPEQLFSIAKEHFKKSIAEEKIKPGFLKDLINHLHALGEITKKKGGRRPGTAEYLDTVRACINLRINNIHDEYWQAIARVTFGKKQGNQGIKMSR